MAGDKGDEFILDKKKIVLGPRGKKGTLLKCKEHPTGWYSKEDGMWSRHLKAHHGVPETIQDYFRKTT